MSHPLTSVCCAEVSGAKEDVASKTLNALEEWKASQPVGSFEPHRIPYTKRKAREHVRKVGFPLLSWFAWLAIRTVVWEVVKWWWLRQFQTTGDVDRSPE